MCLTVTEDQIIQYYGYLGYIKIIFLTIKAYNSSIMFFLDKNPNYLDINV